MKFIKIEPGSFLMGSPISEKERENDEIQHEVILTEEFEIMNTPVTQKEWKKVMAYNPSHFRGDYHPVENISWVNTQEFISKLNQSQKEFIYRLPTEAEWEYCCRAGSKTAYYFGDNSKELYKYAVCDLSGTKSVRSNKPNKLGLYDMHGNVWEWCQDWYGPYPEGKVTDSTGPESGSYRVILGGCWNNFAGYLRSAQRNYWGPGDRNGDLGFRLVRTSSLSFNSLPLESEKRASELQIIQDIRESLNKLEKRLKNK